VELQHTFFTWLLDYSGLVIKYALSRKRLGLPEMISRTQQLDQLTEGTVRRLYRRIVPESLRQLRWTITNDFRYVFGDRQASRITLDYEHYWERKEAEGQLWLSYREIVDVCDRIIPENSTVLDIGCGDGLFLSRLKERKAISELGVDISAKAIELAMANGVNAKVLDVIHEDVSELGTFDYVTAFEVLEHLPNPEVLLTAVSKLGKHILVSIPNTGYYLQRLRMLFGRFPRQWIQHPGEHLRFWTLRDFRLTADLCGYRIAKVIPIRGRQSLSRYLPELFGEALFFLLEPCSVSSSCMQFR
jgi:methionine biosynthesis protein MetW